MTHLTHAAVVAIPAVAVLVALLLQLLLGSKWPDVLAAAVVVALVGMLSISTRASPPLLPGINPAAALNEAYWIDMVMVTVLGLGATLQTVDVFRRRHLGLKSATFG